MLENKKVLVIAEIAILTALGVGLDLLANVITGGIFPSGGSISIAMVPIMIIAIRRGLVAGLVTGLLVGMIQLIYGGHIVNFFSMILDYPIPYMLVGFAGVFVKDHKITRKVLVLGGVFAGLLRYLSHFLAGVTFWRAYVPTEAFMGIKGFNAFTWSVFYNALYMVPSIFLSVQVLLGLYKYASHLLEDENPKDLLTIED